MKSINCLFMLTLMFPLAGCASRPDYTLNPPANANWIDIALKLPAQVEVMPMDALYRSEKCQREIYDQKIESHRSLENGKNPQVVRMIKQKNSDIWQHRFALNGGGKCEWKLSTVRVDMKLMRNTPLTQGKNPTSVSYVFAFDDEFYSGGGMPGQRKRCMATWRLKRIFSLWSISIMPSTKSISICLVVMSEKQSGADITEYMILRKLLLPQSSMLAKS
ncbi:hypothetical protein PAS25_17835 [Leclercia adecarboxylata]|uniref:hypothetical protein n=1 Tax=Leclercia adecarboxylata TaxID=83655 RepID=UPI00210033DC|nr:hypothetical protein [Leclercia adecarboxylata]